MKGLLDKIVGILDSEEPQNAMALRSFIPADIADDFLNAMQENDIQRAKKIVSDKAAAMEVFHQLNSNVNLDEKVPVIDISGSMEQAAAMSNKDIKQYVKNLIDEWEGDKTKDGDFFVNILPKDVNHITYSSMRRIKREIKGVRKSSILNLEDLIRSAALIESVPNRKTDKKPHVKMYHKFFIPVFTGEKTMVMCLVTEEQKNNKTIHTTEINLYDITIPKRGNLTAATGHISSHRQSGKIPFDMSIREMLTNVKGDDGNYYINADGSGNYAKILNQRSTEENTLVGVHNLSAANLRHVLKIGGLANPSIGIVDITKQALEGYGEITLIAPTPLIDKSTGRNAGTYAADIYSPRYPSVDVELTAKAYKEITQRVRDALKKNHVDSILSDIEYNAKDLTYSSGLKS